MEELERIVLQIHRHFPKTRINIRLDSGFCRDSIMTWCGDHGVGFVLGLVRNRRVVGKAEYLSKGQNPLFVVTNLKAREAAARRLYEKLYCARGEIENHIKEQQLDHFSDRSSAHTMRANQLRLYVSSFAYVLMHTLRRLGTGAMQFARARCSTLRLKLLKIGARLKITTRRVWLSFSQAYPHAETFAQALATLRKQPL